MTKEKKIYQTSDFHIASWFIQNELELLEVDWKDPKRAKFVFEDFKNRKKLIKEFYTNEDIQGKIHSDREAKSRMYTEKPPVTYDRPE